MRGEDERERRFGRTLKRIGILLGVLVLLILAPGIMMLVRAWTDGGEPPRIRNVDVWDVRGEDWYRFLRPDPDGRYTCVLRMPAPRWGHKVGYSTTGGGRCQGEDVAPMPEEMDALAEEARRLRKAHRLWNARLVDDDGDGRVDCAMVGRAWLHVEGAACAARPRSDAELFTPDRREAADRVLAIQRELIERWLDPLSARF